MGGAGKAAKKLGEPAAEPPSTYFATKSTCESTKVQGTKYVLGFFFTFEAAIFRRVSSGREPWKFFASPPAPPTQPLLVI
jgi:hypothetical protein